MTALWWMRTVLSEDGPESPTTRLVLSAIFKRLNKDIDKGAWPTIETIAHDTALCERTIKTHVNRAILEGWLIRKTDWMSGQRHNHSRYLPALPADVQSAEEQYISSRRSEEDGATGSEDGATSSEDGVRAAPQEEKKDFKKESSSSGEDGAADSPSLEEILFPLCVKLFEDIRGNLLTERERRGIKKRIQHLVGDVAPSVSSDVSEETLKDFLYFVVKMNSPALGNIDSEPTFKCFMETRSGSTSKGKRSASRSTSAANVDKYKRANNTSEFGAKRIRL